MLVLKHLHREEGPERRSSGEAQIQNPRRGCGRVVKWAADDGTWRPLLSEGALRPAGQAQAGLKWAVQNEKFKNKMK